LKDEDQKQILEKGLKEGRGLVQKQEDELFKAVNAVE